MGLPERVCREPTQTRSLLFPIVFYNVFAPREGLQGADPNSGSAVVHCVLHCFCSQRGLAGSRPKLGLCCFPLCFTMFLLPERVGREPTQTRALLFSIVVYNVSAPRVGLQGADPNSGSAVFHCVLQCFCSQRGFAGSRPKLGLCCFPLWFTMFLLPEWVCREPTQTRALLFSIVFYNVFAPREGWQGADPNSGSAVFHCVLQCFCSQRGFAGSRPKLGLCC